VDGLLWDGGKGLSACQAANLEQQQHGGMLQEQPVAEDA
jgi:hypothetical protein